MPYLCVEMPFSTSVCYSNINLKSNPSVDIPVFDTGIPITHNTEQCTKNSSIKRSNIPCELEELFLRTQLSHHRSSHSAEVSQTWSADFSGGISTSGNTAACLLMWYKMNHFPEQFSPHHLLDHVHYFSILKPADESLVQSSSCWHSISTCNVMLILSCDIPVVLDTVRWCK